MTLSESASPTPEPTPGVDSSGMVTEPFPCRKCSYNLLGLNGGGRCPECGTPIGFSLKGELLRFSQPEWLETLRSGVRLTLYSFAVEIGGVVIMAIVSALIWHHLLHLLVTSPLIIGAVLSLIGSWQFTTPDPSGLGEDQYGTSRKLIRIGLALFVVNHAISLIQSESTLSPVEVQAADCLSVVIQLFGCVGSVAEMLYLSKLALRLPDDKLSDRARFLMYGFGITQSVFVAVSATRRLTTKAPAVPGRASGSALGLLGGLDAIFLLVFLVMYLLLLAKLGKRFKEAAESARWIWRVPGVL